MDGIKVEGHWRFIYDEGTENEFVIERKNLITQSGLNFLAALLAGEYVSDNLIPPFSEWTLHPNAVVIEPYKLQVNTSVGLEAAVVTIPGTPGKQYTLSGVDNSETLNNYYSIQALDAGGTSLGELSNTAGANNNWTFTAPTGTVQLRMAAWCSVAGSYSFYYPMLNIGPVAFPFSPKEKASVNNFPYYLAIGSGANVATNADIKLQTETFRKLVSSVTRQSNMVRLRTFLIQSEANGDHQEFGIYLAGTEEKDKGILLNRLVTPISKTDNTVLTVEVRITFNAG